MPTSQPEPQKGRPQHGPRQPVKPTTTPKEPEPPDDESQDLPPDVQQLAEEARSRLRESEEPQTAPQSAEHHHQEVLCLCCHLASTLAKLLERVCPCDEQGARRKP